jgi:hypothetical protein
MSPVLHRACSLSIKLALSALVMCVASLLGSHPSVHYISTLVASGREALPDARYANTTVISSRKSGSFDFRALCPLVTAWASA